MNQSKENDTNAPMTAMLRSHVERCLQDIWGVTELTTDSDNDYPYRWGTAACWIAVQTEPEPAVRVFAHAVHGVKPTAKLLAELNDINARSRWTRVFLSNGALIVDGEIHWTTVDPRALERLARAVAGAADGIGSLVAAVHGGTTPFPSESENAQDEESA